MNVNLYNTTDYENKWQRTLGENKPNTNPIKANQSQNKPNQTQFQRQKKCCGVCPEDFGERKQAKMGIDVNEQA